MSRTPRETGTPDGGFGTGTLRAHLGRRSAASGLLAVTGRGGQILLRLGSIAVLARLLTPEDFGVRALVLPLTILLNSLLNLRLNVAALQREDLTPDDLSRLFWLSARMNLVIVVGMAAMGPVLSAIYDDPRVVAVTAIWAASMYVLNLGAFHEALLKRQLRFGVVAVIETVSLALSMTVAILAATRGAGYWALVAEFVTLGILRAAAAWVACAWRPAWSARHWRRDTRLSELLAYGRNLTGYRFVQWLGSQTDRVIVGTIGGASVVGLYDAARRWAWMPTMELHLAVSDVAVASFSRAQDRPREFRKLLRGSLGAVLGLSIPATTFILIESDPIVRLVFGDQWLGAIPFVRILAAGAIAGALIRPCQWVFNAFAETRLQLRWGFVQTGVLVTGLAIGSLAGGRGVAAGYAIATALLVVPTVLLCLGPTPATPRDYFAASGRPLGASVIAGLAVTGVAAIAPLARLALVPRLGTAGLVFGTIYAASWIALPGGRRELAEAVALLRALAGPERTDGSASGEDPGLSELP